MMILICGSYPGLSHYFNFIFLKENKNPPIAFSGPRGIVSWYIILESFFDKAKIQALRLRACCEDPGKTESGEVFFIYLNDV